MSGAVSGSGIRQGFALVYSPHTTAAIRVNELEERLHQDMEAFLRRLVPPDGPSRHNLETVERLTPRVRDRRCGYQLSLDALARAKDIAPAVEFLLGDGGRFITGQKDRSIIWATSSTLPR